MQAQIIGPTDACRPYGILLSEQTHTVHERLRTVTTQRFLATLVFLALASHAASAQTHATQAVTFQVDAINRIAFSGSPSLVVSTANAGGGPIVATANASWAVTTNQSGAKITASIATAMPDGVTLQVNLTAPAGASSLGAQPLSTTAVNLVTSITKIAQTMAVVYSLSATAGGGVVPSQSRTVTYTLTGGT